MDIYNLLNDLGIKVEDVDVDEKCLDVLLVIGIMRRHRHRFRTMRKWK